MYKNTSWKKLPPTQHWQKEHAFILAIGDEREIYSKYSYSQLSILVVALISTVAAVKIFREKEGEKCSIRKEIKGKGTGPRRAGWLG